MKFKAVLIPVPYEKTVSGRKGTADAPKAIIEMLNTQIENYDRFIKENTFDKVEIIPTDELDVRELSPEEMVKSVKSKMDNVDEFSILLGGEHSVSIGAVKSFKEKFDDLAVVHIDAHLDMRDDDSDYNLENPSKYAHCCVMRRVREIGCSSVHVGIRSIYSKEMEYAKQEKIKIFECPLEVDEKEIVNAISSKNVYITLDVDGIDPCHMPGTGTPVQGGLEWYFVIKLLKKIFKEKNVVGADIVEVSPLSENNITEIGAAQLLYHMIGFKYYYSLNKE